MTYFNVVGVDVVRAHGVGVGVLQDDPGVVDWTETQLFD